MKVKTSQLDAFARKPDPAARAILIYGPDQGLVRERADLLARTVVPEAGDPFRVAELTSAQLAREPALLADEAAALAFGGGRRIVRVRDGGEDALRAFSSFLAEPAGDALVIVEAGDLDSRSKLRQLFEKSGQAAALPCYRDDARSLPTLIRQALKEDGLDVSADAVDYLAASLGGDRLLSRGELRKLALYKGSGRVELADAQACIGDSAALSLEDVAFACGDGDLGALERTFDRAMQEGASPVQPLRAAARHFQRLHLVAGSASLDQAMGKLRPPVFWKTRDRFKAQAQAWTPALLGWALACLLNAEGQVKTTGMPAETLSARELMRIATRSPVRKRRRR